jgi:hypothetical protein
LVELGFGLELFDPLLELLAFFVQALGPAVVATGDFFAAGALAGDGRDFCDVVFECFACFCKIHCWGPLRLGHREQVRKIAHVRACGLTRP